MPINSMHYNNADYEGEGANAGFRMVLPDTEQDNYECNGIITLS